MRFFQPITKRLLKCFRLNIGNAETGIALFIQVVYNYYITIHKRRILMQEERVPLISTAVIVQAIVFLLMTSYGSMSVFSFSGRTICVVALWVYVFSMVDYTYTREIRHAIKMAIVYTVIWGAIETGMDFVLNRLLNMGFFTVGGAWYGIQNLLCLCSVLAFNHYFDEDGKEIKKSVIALLVVGVAVYLFAVHYVIENVPNTVPSTIFEHVTSTVNQQDIILKRIAAIFYGIEGFLISFSLERQNN